MLAAAQPRLRAGMAQMLKYETASDCTAQARSWLYAMVSKSPDDCFFLMIVYNCQVSSIFHFIADYDSSSLVVHSPKRMIYCGHAFLFFASAYLWNVNNRLCFLCTSSGWCKVLSWASIVYSVREPRLPFLAMLIELIKHGNDASFCVLDIIQFFHSASCSVGRLCHVPLKEVISQLGT